MRKNLFGYNISEVNITLSNIREENESLNATITSLKEHIKKLEAERDIKGNHSNVDYKSLEADLKKALEERDQLASKLAFEQAQKEIAATKLQTNSLSTTSSTDEEYEKVKQALASAKTALSDKLSEFDLVKKETEQLREQLISSNKASEELAVLQVDKQIQDLSYQAYYDMLKIQNEVTDYLREQLKGYYQSVDDSNNKIHSEIEQRKQEYDQMIQDFITKVSEFRNSLSHIEYEHASVSDFRRNIDTLDERIKSITNHYFENAIVEQKKMDASEEALPSKKKRRS